MITYLVSGDADIEPTQENLRRYDRVVLHGSELQAPAVDVLQDGRFVVVAHGAADGTVFWSNGAGETPDRWLWVGMEPSPARSRVYLYCCKAGPSLVPYLQQCECIGHCDVVPMPVDPDTELVMSYLGKVDELMQEIDFDLTTWRTKLSEFVTEQFDRELREPTSIRAPCIWLMLSRSL